VPVTHIGEPEMITSTSSARTVPSPSSVASISSTISSVVSTLRMSREVTPHVRASRRCTAAKGVKAMIGVAGRSWEMSRAENPDCVKATMARASSARAALAAASDTASGKPTGARFSRRRRVGSCVSAACSARSAMRAMTSTASAG